MESCLTRQVCILAAMTAWLANCASASPSSPTGPRPAPAATAAPPPTRLAEAHAHYAAGVVHELNNDRDRALAEFSRAGALDPENETLALELSSRLLARRQFEQALEVIKKPAARADASGRVFLRLGLIYGQLGRLDDAIVANREAITRSPQDLAGYQNLYHNLVQKNRRDEAFEVLQQAVTVPGVDAEFLINLAELFTNFARQFPTRKDAANAAAVEVLDRADQLEVRLPELRLKLADGFYVLGQDIKAADHYRRLLRDYPDSFRLESGVRARLIEIYLRAGERQPAMEQLAAILQDDPANAMANYQLGDLALSEHEFARAADCFRRVVVLRPEFEPPYYQLAQAQISLNRSQEALETLADARRKFRGTYVGEFLAGIACARQNKFDDAITHFTEAELIARAADPQRLNEAFYYQLGSVYERKGDWAQAEKHLQRSLELAPEFADAQNYLGYMWAERGTNLVAARELIEKALKTEPKNAAYLDSLGWVLFKLKRPAEALPLLLQAIELSPEPDATLFDHLGDIYAALGQKAKAREAWKKSLAIEPSGVIRRKLGSTLGR